MTRWHSTRSVVVNTFDRHDFAFKWSHAEFDSAHNLVPWIIDQVADAYSGIAGLVGTVVPLFEGTTYLQVHV
jgi:adenine-specific DNA methylase